jgi:methylenetetrahydrofolate--tRNA-(uracil-5-)-methyltransferase
LRASWQGNRVRAAASNDARRTDGYVSDESVRDFQPMGSNMGLLPPLDARIRDKAARYRALAERSLEALGRAVSELEE